MKKTKKSVGMKLDAKAIKQGHTKTKIDFMDQQKYSQKESGKASWSKKKGEKC